MKRQVLATALALAAFAALIALSPPSPAIAQMPTRPAAIGTQPITVNAPPGACFLERATPADAEVIAAIERTITAANELVAVFADCTELDAWRTTRTPLAHHGQFQTMAKMKDRSLTMPRRTFASNVCAHNAAATSNASGMAGPEAFFKKDRRRIEAEVAALALNQQRFLGVVDAADDGCYTALAQRFRTGSGSGDETTQFGIIATTLARGRIVYIYLYAPASGIDGFKALFEKSRRLVRAFLKANDG